MRYVPVDGKAQHALIVNTHGGNLNPITPTNNPRLVYGLHPLNQALASRGYLVMMLVRRGYGNSQGPDSEFLDTPEESGLAGAQDIKAAVNYMQTRPDVLKNQIVIMGQSQGGWVSLAASTLDMEGVLGAVNISGATHYRLGQYKNVRSPEHEAYLEKAAQIYGTSSRIPVLWLYAENDNHRPATVRQWFNVFTKAGGKGKLVIKPSYKDNGHNIVKEPDLYLADIVSFFNEIGFGK
jgi:pimeloyl-ACP methyl ester carboxylesterase